MLLKSRKGISPLLATVLLIAFVVALIIIVMLWGSGIIKEEIEKQTPLAKGSLSCQVGVDIDVKEAKCIGNNVINIKIVNEKDTYISGFQFRVIGIDGRVYATTTNIPLSGHAEDTIPLSYDPLEIGDVEQVEIMPRLLVDGVMITCSENSVITKLDQLDICNP